MKYLIGLDIGTSSVKGVLVSEDGTEWKTDKAEFTYTYRENGGVEIDAEDYMTACSSLLRRLAKAVPEGGTLRGISAASASGNLLLLDENGRPSTPIFNWQDGRVNEEARDVLEEMDAGWLYEKSGWPFDYKTFPLAMLCWIKCHRPELLKRCSKVCMSTEYLYYRLTGRWGISTSAGSPFYLIDQQSGTYIRELLDLFGLREEQLPRIGRAGDIVGTLTAEGEAESGIPTGTPVVLGTFDHPSAARGAGVLEEGQMLLSCGTSWVGFFPLRERRKALAARMIVDPFLAPAGCFGGMVSVPSISDRINGMIRRYIDDSDDRFEVFAAEAAKSRFGAGGLAIRLLEEPDDEAIRRFPKRHIARAIMEGTVRLLAEKLEGLKENGITARSAVMVGGPSECPLWARVIEEMTGLSVRVVDGPGAYAGALGAAMMAGIAAGLYRNEAAAFAALRSNQGGKADVSAAYDRV